MSKIQKIKTCERCGREFLAESGYVHFCDECKAIVVQEKKKRNNNSVREKKIKKILETGIEGVDYVIDMWNGLPTTSITGKWFKCNHPDKTIEDYVEEFPNSQLICEKLSKKLSKASKERMNMPEWKLWASERMKGIKNINSKENTTLEQRQRISPFSKSFMKYDGLSDEEKQKEIRKNLQCDRDDRSTNQIKYWINKGYSEEDAIKKVSDRQRTFTIEKCIDKYGEEIGRKIYNERQIKWSEKIEKKYRNGEFSKSPKSCNSVIYSKFEKEIIQEILNLSNIDLSETKSYQNRQLTLNNIFDNNCNNIEFMYDFTYRNKIIEYNGDYWHMNPNKYSEDFYNELSKTTAKDKWKMDEIKLKCAKAYGYDVLIIWESDYKKDKDGTIQKCLDFLLDRK